MQDRIRYELKDASRSAPRQIQDTLERGEIAYFERCPIEERGRNLKPHASNELVHIDAGAYGATNGARILRFFVNVHPTRDRVWHTRGSFPTTALIPLANCRHFGLTPYGILSAAGGNRP